MKIGLFITEAIILFILTFIYCTIQISSRVSMEENEDKNN